MTRLAVVFDRLATLLLGVALVAVGAGAVAWQRGELVDGRSLSFAAAADATRMEWWPWASGGVGILLVIAGIRWLLTHKPARKASRVTLKTPAASLPPSTADATSVAHAAAVAIQRDPAVLKASGDATIERGRPTVTVSATVHARHGLRAGARAADDTAREVATMLGDTVAVRTVLRVNAKKKHGTVV